LGFPLFSSPSQNPISVTARETSSGYLLSGQQEYLVLAGLAEKTLIPATIKGETGFAYFFTDLTQSGVSVSKPVRSLGITACPVSDVTFDNVLSSKCCESIDGNKIFNLMTRKVSIAIAAMETGIMTGSFKEALDYTNGRRQGGRKIIHWSEIKKILSCMAINIQVAEMLLKQCISAIENNEKNRDANIEAAVTRISEMACEVTSDGIRVMGGVGYMKDFNQEKRFRDSRHLMSTFGMMQMKKLNFLEKYITKSAIYNTKEVAK
jgi:alkylation response protein AidB-like acyl-CoA dehydrogenase